MATISFTVSAADIARITEAAKDKGYDDAKMFAVHAVKDAVYRYERNRDARAAEETIQNYDATYTPIVLT